MRWALVGNSAQRMSPYQVFGSHPDDPVILHRKELVNRREPFVSLRDPAVNAAFDGELLGLMRSWDYTVISVCLDKKAHRQKYTVWQYDPHDHPLHSGAREQGICRRSPIQHAAIEQPPEDVLTLAPAVEPVAELIEVGLQVPGADPMEDVKRPALEVGEHDVRPGQPLVDVGARRHVAGKVSVAGSFKAHVAAPAVGLHDAAGGDRGLGCGAQALGAGVGGDAGAKSLSAAARGVFRGHGDHGLAGLAASAALRRSVLPADVALVKLDNAAQRELALAARHGVGDLATHEPGGLDGHPELTAAEGAFFVEASSQIARNH